MTRNVCLLVSLVFVDACISAIGVAQGEEHATALSNQSSNLPDNHVVRGHGPETRELLDHIIDMDFCGNAMMEGLNQAAVLRGLLQEKDGEAVRTTEEDVVFVLCEMTEEEFNRLASDGTFHTVADIDRLWKMIALLGTTKKETDAALAILDKMARQATAEWENNLFSAISCAWIDLTIENSAVKCLELGRYFLDSRGVDSKEFWRFVDAIGRCDAFGRCQTDGDRDEVSRFLIAASEQCQKRETAGFIDNVAAGDFYFHLSEEDPLACGMPKLGICGWKGSLQRKNMAARFATPTSQARNRLHERAAAELATEDSELTDLREIYGDWNENGH